MSLHKFLTFFVLFPGLILSHSVPRIAIIGGGIGGTSCAYFLRQLFQNRLDISLFERDTVGGRLRLLDIDGKKYEAGGSIIHLRNQYMLQFTRLLGLGIRQPQSSKLGIYDGKKFVFEESDWYFLTIAEVLWHYGLSVFYLNKDVGELLNDFSRIYSLQEKGYSYTTVDRMLNAMSPDFINMTRTTISKILLEKGYPPKFLDEFVQSIIMVNYGQTNDISGFAGYVALAAADSNLWSVEGGNKQVAEGLLRFSESYFKHANVEEVELLSNKKFALKYRLITSNEQFKAENFDAVILSAPLIKNSVNIKFINFTKDFQKYARPYKQIVSTFVKGTLRPAAFSNKFSLPDDILTNKDNLLFNSIGKCSPVDDEGKDNKENVYKVFSQKPLSKESVEKLFESVNGVEEKVWLAYPHYNPPEKFVPFVLHPRLYYINAIELSASAMEMSIIAAKNIALLTFNSLRNNGNKIDAPVPILKDEL